MCLLHCERGDCCSDHVEEGNGELDPHGAHHLAMLRIVLVLDVVDRQGQAGRDDDAGDGGAYLEDLVVGVRRYI